MRYGRRNPLSKVQKENRLKQYSVRGGKKWIDPYPQIHGTYPEKIVYAELSARGIPFYFLNQFATSIPELNIFKEYQADFWLPNQKIIIEVQGFFWHTKPGAIESDAFKFAMYEAMGYKPLAWWDFDIIANVHKLFLDEPLLAGFQRKSQQLSAELTPIKRTKIDTSKGIRTLNTKRALRNSYRKAPIRFGKRKKTSNSYLTGV